MNLNKADIIAFYSTANFFRLKTEEKKLTRFEELKPEFLAEFGIEADNDIFKLLNRYHELKTQEKLEAKKARIKKLESLPVAAGFEKAHAHIYDMPAGKYVLTAAQNNTHLDENMFKSLVTFCEHNGAKLLIGRLTYNKSGFCQPDINNSGLWYDEKIKPYLVSGQINLDNFAHFCSDANVIPTSKLPISGFESLTPPGIHAVIPATKLSLQMVAALKNSPTKILTSTGAVTLRNYIMRKAGSVASTEHNISAVFVDTEKGEIRQLEQMPDFTGFYDKLNYYTPEFVNYIPDCVGGFQPGDIHAEKMTQENLKNLCELLGFYQPSNLFIHDLMDFSSRNHHNIKDCNFIHLQHVNNVTIRKEIKTVTKILDTLANYASQTHIIESNHDLAINTWLKNADFKNDPVNATLYLECMLALYKHQEKSGNSDFNMLEYVYNKIGRGKQKDKIVFHKIDDSLMLYGVEMGNHGHLGTNGARGNPKSFRVLGLPVNTGHTHTPSIYGKVYTAGVAADLEMGYNHGASSWAYCHILTYTNGQRQLIFS